MLASLRAGLRRPLSALATAPSRSPASPPARYNSGIRLDCCPPPSRETAERVAGFDPNGSVWVEFSPLAAAVGAANLGQGFPDMPLPEFISEALVDAARAGAMGHQYTRSRGHPGLVRALVDEYSGKLGGALDDPDSQVLVTSGASAAIYAAINALVDPGEEVVLMEPFYDSYPASVELAGAVARYVPLEYTPEHVPAPPGSGRETVLSASGWKLDLDKLEAAISPVTRMLVLTTPHNPTGKVFSRAELEGIAELACKHDLIVLADEVYDSLVYSDSEPHVSIGSLPGMFQRTITLGSAGKTFSVTGWRLGWALGPPKLITALWLVSQYITFASPTPLQAAAAALFPAAHEHNYFTDSVAALQAKRDLLVGALARAGLDPIAPQGSYFALADTGSLPGPFPFEPVAGVPVGETNARDYQVCRWLTQSAGVTAIPPSAFYSPDHAELAANYARFCFCKADDTLAAGIEALNRLG
ncbi:aminotransferase class I and II [Thecamonas trahens ATCC 50062]|uniref:Aminotransferase class I and II n=1 Tax=Thecamonas trahens ATCC 50062 TaxID=461836 RepID=A0A0L0D6J1_THETB|nr:aminotransferase class I and II [Thecamonas trahens ATCC 50062]KNC47969.1 aminotransferase class I and II [Thecamonas trahens ATCC 50062]|eukprot:XP_013758986.1 aminotransferase class I and II [Thecamonas trahens ATCC 50062]